MGTILLVRTLVEAVAPDAGLWATIILSIHPGILFGAAVARHRNGLPFLRWRPIAYVGTSSYGMYLLHMLVTTW